MLRVYETSKVPNNQPSWCHYPAPPVVSHFFGGCYCLIKTHQSTESIDQNLLSFDCVFYTWFRVQCNRNYIWDNHCLQGTESLFGSNGSCEENQAVKSCTKHSRDPEKGAVWGLEYP